MRPSDPQTVSVLPGGELLNLFPPSSLRSFPTFPFNELNVYPLLSFRVSFNASVATNKKFCCSVQKVVGFAQSLPRPLFNCTVQVKNTG